MEPRQMGRGEGSHATDEKGLRLRGLVYASGDRRARPRKIAEGKMAAGVRVFSRGSWGAARACPTWRETKTEACDGR